MANATKNSLLYVAEGQDIFMTLAFSFATVHGSTT